MQHVGESRRERRGTRVSYPPAGGTGLPPSQRSVSVALSAKTDMRTALRAIAMDPMRTASRTKRSSFRRWFVGSCLAGTSLIAPLDAVSGGTAPLARTTSEFQASLLKGEAKVCKAYVERL